jgi:ubiquinone biosynthesis protein
MAVLRGDSAGLRDAIEQVATIESDVPDAVLERALAHFLSEYMAPGAVVSAAMLEDLIPLLASFEIRLPADLTTVFRALATLDGTVRTIRPGYSVVEGMRRMFDGDGPRPAMVGGLREQFLSEMTKELPRLRRLPAHIDRIATLATRGQLRAKVSLFSSEQDTRVIATMVNRIVLGVLGGMVAVASAILLTIEGGAQVIGGTTLTRVFGFVGLFVAAALVLRVVAAIIRDGYN